MIYDRQILSQIVSKDGNSNLYEHMKKMNKVKVDLNDQTKFFDLFEDISLRLKTDGIYGKPEEKIITTTSEKVKSILKPLVKEGEEGENGEPAPVTQINYVPDYVELFQKLSFAGISFGDKESVLINNSLKKLSLTLQNGGNVQFFGKIMGTEKDYYIAEGIEVDSAIPEINYDPDMEKIKEDGVNRNLYYVTTDLSGKWEELPVVKPKQIIQSRKIRYNFTGDLNRQIISNPTFQGQEKHLLRCMIARITHAAKLVPKCVWKYSVDEDAESPFKPLVEDKEKPKIYSNSDLIDMNNWVHYLPGILKCGRVSHYLEEPPEGVDPDEFKKKVMAKDPFDKRMQSINNDRQFILKKGKGKGMIPWRIDQYYEDNIYVNPYIKVLRPDEDGYDADNIKNNKMNYTITVVKSLRWPGAINILIGTESFFFYFGNGMKFLEEGESFSFKDFPKFPIELPDREDQPEPHLPKEVISDEKKNEDAPKDE